MRLVLPAVVCVLLSGALAAADEQRPTLRAEDWPLLPINDLERQELARDHPDLVRQATQLGARIRKLESMRQARPDPNDDAGRKIGDQARSLRARLQPLLAKAVESLGDEVIDDALLRRIRAVAPGPLRSIRHATSLVAIVEGVPEPAKDLLAHVQPRLEGALLSLEARKHTLRARGEKGGLERRDVDALIGGIDLRMRVLERRYWRLVDYIVPEEARAALHRRLPSTHQKRETVLEYLFTLPALTASQATRLRAVLTEVEAQAAPDQALIKRLRATLDQQDDRRAAHKSIAEAGHRVTELHRWATTEARKILNDAQWRAFEAIPPRVRLQDRKQTSVDVLKGVTLSDEQRRTLDGMRDELRTYRDTYRKRRTAAALQMRGMGEDSPEMAGAMMAMAAVEAEGNVVQRRFNGRVLVELLRPDQVVAWVITPPDDVR